MFARKNQIKQNAPANPHHLPHPNGVGSEEPNRQQRLRQRWVEGGMLAVDPKPLLFACLVKHDWVLGFLKSGSFKCHACPLSSRNRYTFRVPFSNSWGVTCARSGPTGGRGQRRLLVPSQSLQLRRMIGSRWGWAGAEGRALDPGVPPPPPPRGTCPLRATWSVLRCCACHWEAEGLLGLAPWT